MKLYPHLFSTEPFFSVSILISYDMGLYSRTTWQFNVVRHEVLTSYDMRSHNRTT